MSSRSRTVRSSEALQVRLRDDAPQIGDAGHSAPESLANITPIIDRAFKAWIRRRQITDTETTHLPPAVPQAANRRKAMKGGA